MAAAGLISVAPAAGSAFASRGVYPSQLRQPVPVTAAGFDGEHQKTCAEIPATQDGWHFVLPGNDASFVKLTVVFEPGGQQVVTSFPNNPAGKHAYVGSAKGATLVSAVAEVEGGDQPKFNLSHTCPASVTETTPPPKTPPTENPKPSASESPKGSESPSPSASVSASASVSVSASASASASGSPSRSGSGTPSPSGSTSGPAAGPSASASTGSGPKDGSLAFTGASVIGTTVAGVALLGAGGYLVSRRRKGAHR
ncbi:hypothetical protein KSE_10550 [Kitasatospora setae KM-6054]|uniref:Gram-positive cocci surface proteins LPxTG domain-containing protein n=1 Tax=Kitasatospora setae (strain ATCC 33774 / DSM 43861 / JCM 3304 / KCC A-0304 / NBRC 14216 / KM-6054) TaxID=452652 RepID=E4N6Q8_KITSK|nr:hypothetical protein KSE_10550 [Kitasatospora setae KM-6054]